MIKNGLKLIIRLYQACLSPLHRPCCRFVPTCSAYALDAVERHGAARGGLMALRRIVKCHPFGPSGYDPVEPAEPS